MNDKIKDGVKCQSCYGIGEVGGMTHDGYETDLCPDCPYPGTAPTAAADGEVIGHDMSGNPITPADQRALERAIGKAVEAERAADGGKTASIRSLKFIELMNAWRVSAIAGRGPTAYDAVCDHIDAIVKAARQEGKVEVAKMFTMARYQEDIADKHSVPLPVPITHEELAALRRFDECAQDGEGYDVPKEMMQRLAEIGLIRRKSGNYFEQTDFGLHVLAGNFAAPAASGELPEDVKRDAERWRYVRDTTTAIRNAETGESEPCTPELFTAAVDRGRAAISQRRERTDGGARG